MSPDVVVLGDGPAGAAIADACRRAGPDVTVVGEGRPWANTYAAWMDDVALLPAEVFAGRRDRVVVRGHRDRELRRPYATFDNAALRRHLRLDEVLLPGRAVSWRQDGERVEVVLGDGSRLGAAWAVDATGAPGGVEPVAWQTAYGAFVDHTDLPDDLPTDAVTLMRWHRGGPAPSFLYAVPVGERWLVEETVLAASPRVPPSELRPGLVAHLGGDAVARAEAEGRIEQVVIPMGLPIVRPDGPVGRVVPFGAAAGAIHPATGYSVATAIRTAPRVAAAIAAGDPVGVADALWPASARRARRLHDYGLRALLDLDADATADFFDAFFSLPVDVWRDYLRVDTGPAVVARAMSQVFVGAPWPVRRRLVAAGPRAVVRRLGGR